MKTLLFYITFIFIFGTTAAFGQSPIIGQLQDEKGEPLSGANIVLLQAKDSVLVGYALSNVEGRFRLENVADGAYLLRVSYIGFGDVERSIEAESDSRELDLGLLRMQSVSALLKEVEVKAERLPVVIRGDTVAYDAAFFGTQPDAEVEDLLKKLPGVEVDGEGNIRAQGEEVQQILVDGKEFFGDDPKVATRNIPADAIDKIQVFDRHSDAENFTGLDDGIRRQTINLQLKPDRRNGIFGKLNGGYGSKERYTADANAFKFGENRQIAFIGMANNINRTGFSLMDYFNFGGGMQSGGGHQMVIGGNGSQALPIGDERAQGFYRTAAAGLNYNQDWGKKVELRASYFYWQNRSDLSSQTSRIFPTLQPILTNNINEQSSNKLGNHRLDLGLRLRPDTLQRFSLQGQLFLQDQDNQRMSSNQRLLGQAEELNSTANQTYRNGSQSLFGNLQMSYQRKLGQADRVLSLNTSWRKSAPDQHEKLTLLETQWRDGGPVSIDSLNQRQTFKDRPEQWQFGMGISESWGPYWLTRIGYDYRIEQEQPQKTFFDIQAGEEVLNTNLSTNFGLHYDSHIPRFSIQWKKDKQRWEAGLAWQATQARLQEAELPLQKPVFQYLLPRLRYRYQGSNFSALDLQYQTQVSLPSARQLATIPDNSDPNRLYLGNPDLIPEYQHQLRASYNRFDMFSGISVLLYNTTIYTLDKFSSDRRIDALSRQQEQPINIQDAWQNTSYLSFSHPIRFLKMNVQWEMNATYLDSEVRLNETATPFGQWLFSGGLRIDNRNKDVIDFALGYRLVRSSTKYRAEEANQPSFSRHDFSADLTAHLSDRFRITSNWTVRTFQNQAFAQQAAIPIGQFALSYYIDRKQRTSLEISVFDVLDKNRGIDRQSQGNYLEERLTQSLGRYFMLKVGHRFRVI